MTLILKLSELDWAVLTYLVSILRPFMEVQKQLEGEQYVTSAYSECLFLVAGLTIANDRTRLLPEYAHALVLLHGVLLSMN